MSAAITAKPATSARPAMAARWLRRILSFLASIADPRVDERVEKVDDQVDDYEREREHQHGAADRFVLRLPHRREDVGAHAVPVEHRFGEHGAAEQVPELEARQGHD